MKTQTIILASAILFTGLMAGIFFTWSNAVKPGIGKLSDLEYLKAFQSMNRVILNNAFRLVFTGALIAVALVPVFYLICILKIFFGCLYLLSSFIGLEPLVLPF